MASLSVLPQRAMSPPRQRRLRTKSADQSHSPSTPSVRQALPGAQLLRKLRPQRAPQIVKYTVAEGDSLWVSGHHHHDFIGRARRWAVGREAALGLSVVMGVFGRASPRGTGRRWRGWRR